MITPDDTAHAGYLRQGPDHYRWRRHHLQALTLQKGVGTAALPHVARIPAREAEIAPYMGRICHGDAQAEAPPPDAHARFEASRAKAAEHHTSLLDAIPRHDRHPEDDA